MHFEVEPNYAGWTLKAYVAEKLKRPLTPEKLEKLLLSRALVHEEAQLLPGTLIWPDLLNGNSLLTSKVLAGYATTAGGRRLALAMFVNNVHVREPGDRERIGQVLGALCEAICEPQ